MISKHAGLHWQQCFWRLCQGYDPMLEISLDANLGKQCWKKHTSQASAGCLMTGGVVWWTDSAGRHLQGWEEVSERIRERTQAYQTLVISGKNHRRPMEPLWMNISYNHFDLKMIDLLFSGLDYHVKSISHERSLCLKVHLLNQLKPFRRIQLEWIQFDFRFWINKHNMIHKCVHMCISNTSAHAGSQSLWMLSPELHHV